MRTLLALLALPALADTIEVPRASDPGVTVSLFAQEPLVKQPVGMTIDRGGRVLVIESHTHFPPKDYAGPKADRVLWLRDDDGDGKADRSEVYFEGTIKTMDIATAPDGSIYLAARNEILRLHDDNNDGKVDRVDRKLVWLESKADYPHNGISGLAFDGKGGLFFGVGENLAAPYVITGSDGSSYTFQTEGGNVFHVTTDGAKLHRFSTGFWNPFGVCRDSEGNVFVADNDPDSRPPCRLHHLIDGGNHGYEIRYGRSGLHPFQAWDGELPGTLPMLGGTGEAPCDIIEYLPAPTDTFRGLPAPWHRQLLVASWSDHTIEAYKVPTPANPFVPATKSILVQGGLDFRPVAFATAADGTLYVSDWVKRSYELHGFGRVWRIAGPASKLAAVAPPASGITERQRQIDPILNAKDVAADQALRWLADTNAWRFSAAITRLSREPALLRSLAADQLTAPQQRVGFLTAAEQSRDPELRARIPALLRDADPTVQLLTLKWAADDRIEAVRGDIEKLLDDPAIAPAVFYGALTAVGRIESAEIKESDMLKRLKDRVAAAGTSDRIKRIALEIMTERERNLTAREIPQTQDPVFREWLMHALGTLQDAARMQGLRSIAWDDRQPPAVRAAALAHIAPDTNDVEYLVALAQTAPVQVKRAVAPLLAGLPLTDAQKPALAQAVAARGQTSTNRPAFTDVAGWTAFLAAVPGTPDLARGREVFLSPKLGSCITCHRLEGIGSIAGPNLSTIGASKAADYILESILQPNRNVSPQFEAFMLTSADGQTQLAFQLAEHDDRHTYVGVDGRVFNIQMAQIVKRERMPMSIMPEGLVAALTDGEVRDLVAFLRSRK